MTETIEFDDLEDLALEELTVENSLAIVAVDEDGTWLETTTLSTDTPYPVIR